MKNESEKLWDQSEEIVLISIKSQILKWSHNSETILVIWERSLHEINREIGNVVVCRRLRQKMLSHRFQIKTEKFREIDLKRIHYKKLAY